MPQLVQTSISIIKQFLAAGADPSIIVHYWGDEMISKRSGLETIVLEYLKAEIPAEAEDLLAAIEHMTRQQHDGRRSHGMELIKRRRRVDMAEQSEDY